MLDKEQIIQRGEEGFSELKSKLQMFPHWKEVLLAFFAVFLWGAGIYGLFFSPPAEFPPQIIVRVSKGLTIGQTGELLFARGLVRSPLIFKILARLSDGGEVIAGDYRFLKPASVFSVARRLAIGQFGIDAVRVTIPEGLNSREIGDLLAKNLIGFNEGSFVSLAEKQEGYLFPDTYFIKPSDDEGDIVKMMINNFDAQIKEVDSEIKDSGKSLNEILTMASIVELEARTDESRKMVAGILWNRLNKGMKLQVDAVFPYIIDKYSLQLTVADLSFDSPYNTYLYKGLPPGPVSNPGLSAIRAVLDPTKTSYLYYLSDKDGVMHYAKTYTQHMSNRKRYLSN